MTILRALMIGAGNVARHLRRKDRPSYRPAHDNGETWERRNLRKLAG